MVPVSNAVEGLRFWSKRERTDSLYMDHGRKEKGVCQQMSSMLTFCFKLEKAWLPCVCVYICECACVQVSFNFKKNLQNSSLILWINFALAVCIPTARRVWQTQAISNSIKHYRKQNHREQYKNKHYHEPFETPGSSDKDVNSRLKPGLLHVKC